ncbi:MAG: hypothetical protein GY719_28505 [bacterium]|nr:hypothetical protein [bacterium]
MNHIELIGGALAYAATVYSLSLVSWAVARWVLPAGTRVGLRLATVVVGQFVACAIVVQSLGLLGQLRPGPYLVTTLAAGATVSWAARKHRPHQALWRLVLSTARLWLHRTPLGLGFVSAVGFLFLATRRFAYVAGIDSLTIHGPLVAGWIQTGRVTLTSHWNYPQCWEYQYAPNFLLLRSDVLVIIPSVLQVGVLLLLVREVATRLGIPGRIASLVSLLCVSNPVVWGSTMKNDPAFAVGLLLGLIALDQLTRDRQGAIWLAQLGTFMILGNKASGFIYAAPLLALFVTIWLIRRWRQPRLQRNLAWLLAGTLALQLSAIAVQVHNFVRHGNPTYPIELRVAGQVIFEGPADLSGTSILEAGTELGTWSTLFRGSSFQLGWDFPFLLILLLAATLHGVAHTIRAFPRDGRPDRALSVLTVTAVATCLLWVLYLATPWSRGTQADPVAYIRLGHSLRYAIAPICLSYAVSAAFLLRHLGQRRVFGLVSVAFPVLVFAKWNIRNIWSGPVLLVVCKLLALLLGATWAARAVWRSTSRLPHAMKHGARTVATAGVASLLLTFYVQWIEAGRAWKWEQPHRALWQYVRKEIPSGTVIDTNSKEPLYAYFLLGARLKNEIRHTPLRQARRRGPSDSAYYYLSIRSEDRRARELEAMREAGWKPLHELEGQQGVLLRRPR